MADSPITLGSYKYHLDQQILTDETGRELKLRPSVVSDIASQSVLKAANPLTWIQEVL